jgi:hypothetical protein
MGPMSLPKHRIFDPFRGKPGRWLQRAWYQRAYRYPHRNLFVAAVQKSGSTWLANMLADVPGYMSWNPNYIKYEQDDLRDDWIDPPTAGYTVSKAHTAPTGRNVELIHRAGRPYVVIIRDLRDIVVSWTFYVRNRRDDPWNAKVAGLSDEESIDFAIENRLDHWTRWIMDWRDVLDPDLGLIVRYEDLVENTEEVMSTVLDHYGIDPIEPEMVQRIVERHAFKRVTGGRERGQEDTSQFVRKGIIGDWVNHFTDDQKARFKQIASDALIALGYESDTDW